MFLDSDEAYHEMYISLNIKPTVTPSKYFPIMNKSLNIIGKSTYTQSIVALHPRSNYKCKQFKFNLPSYIHQTFNLVKKF